ncbi:MAG: hypothetical protein IH596_12810 [Bacteroidales bacterium]|nr:hypothetical protein [Bacteroidales bacterium]
MKKTWIRYTVVMIQGRSLFILTVLAVGILSAAFSSCSKDNSPRAPLPENPQRIPCEECEPFAGYYELTDVTANTANGSVVWSPLPVSTIHGKIFAGYIRLNTLSEMVVYQMGEAYNSQSFTTEPYTFTLYYNYWIVNDSVLKVGPEKEPGEFYPHRGEGFNRVDTIIWDRCRYVRQ